MCALARVRLSVRAFACAQSGDSDELEELNAATVQAIHLSLQESQGTARQRNRGTRRRPVTLENSEAAIADMSDSDLR